MPYMYPSRRLECLLPITSRHTRLQGTMLRGERMISNEYGFHGASQHETELGACVSYSYIPMMGIMAVVAADVHQTPSDEATMSARIS